MSTATTPGIRTGAIRRAERRGETQMIPQPVAGERGLFTVDSTWGTITPMQIAPGVATVGELEVIEHIEAGLPLIDTRLEHFFRTGTIPTAVNVSHRDEAGLIEHVRGDVPAILFCNGPQCAATPAAIRALLAAGRPAGTILFYRGGIHDWVTLGLPLEHPA